MKMLRKDAKEMFSKLLAQVIQAAIRDGNVGAASASSHTIGLGGNLLNLLDNLEFSDQTKLKALMERNAKAKENELKSKQILHGAIPGQRYCTKPNGHTGPCCVIKVPLIG